MTDGRVPVAAVVRTRTAATTLVFAERVTLVVVLFAQRAAVRANTIHLSAQGFSIYIDALQNRKEPRRFFFVVLPHPCRPMPEPQPNVAASVLSSYVHL